MDRFVWSSIGLHDHEDFLHIVEDITLHDGDDKRAYFTNGSLTLTSHRIIWADNKDQKNCVSLDLSLLKLIEEESGSRFTRSSSKVICHLDSAPSGTSRRPVSKSAFHHVKLVFKSGHTEFTRQLRDCHGRRLWEHKTPASKTVPDSNTSQLSRMTGIAGIERKLQEKQRHTDKTINVAFEDLQNLMKKAEEMVSLSKSIASKIEQKQGAITDDETVQFKSYLLSLGIPDPVTRSAHKSTSVYLTELAKQISSALVQPLEECGGIMTLTDVYCRINRARGMELLSPQDLLDAAKLFQSLNLPVRLRVYDSGVMVVQLVSKSEEKLIAETSAVVRENTSLSADELAHMIGLSIILAKERLLLAEHHGLLCRDDTVEGLRFYHNRFCLGEA